MQMQHLLDIFFVNWLIIHVQKNFPDWCVSNSQNSSSDRFFWLLRED